MTTKKKMAKEMQVVGGLHLLNNRSEVHHLSGLWKSPFRFKGNHDSAKKEITLLLNPYNEDMHFIV